MFIFRRCTLSVDISTKDLQDFKCLQLVNVNPTPTGVILMSILLLITSVMIIRKYFGQFNLKLLLFQKYFSRIGLTERAQY